MNQKIRIDFLDGIRGISALYIILYHTLLFNQHELVLSDFPPLNILQRIISQGHISVAIFIVLSGFCLAIPVVNNDLNLNGGFKRYIKRRANRIIPPYYFAVILSLLLIYSFPLLQEPNNTGWDSKLPVTSGAIISHFLLIHNLSADWVLKINGALWSVATEWQIYFIFPVILYLWKKFHLVISCIAMFAIAISLRKVIAFAHPQYVILFLTGILAAYYSLKNDSRYKYSKILTYFSLFLFLGSVVLFYFIIRATFETEIIIGAAFSYLLFNLVLCVKSGASNTIIKFFESKVCMYLGKISYSVYLIHGPFIALLNLLLLKYFNFSYDAQLLMMMSITIPFIILLGSLFYKLVEKRFLNK